MPLKPGQIKDLKVKIEKIKELQALEKKLKELNDARYEFNKVSINSPNALKFAKKEFDTLVIKIRDEIDSTAEEIRKYQGMNNAKNTALDKVVAAIAKDCSQAIAVYRKAKIILLRGTKGKPDAFMGRSWENRVPKDSSHKAQDIYDAALKSMGFKSLRSNSIFTTSDVFQAEEYGTAYYIFPKNGFNFHWTRFESDLVLDNVGQIVDMDNIEITIDEVENWYYSKTKKKLKWAYNDPYIAVDNIDGFVKALKKLQYPKAKNLTFTSFVKMNYIKNVLGVTDKNFAAAVKGGGEVLLTGEYYAVRTDSKFGDYLLNALKLKVRNITDDEF